MLEIEVGKPGWKCSWLVGNDPIPTVSASILDGDPDELWENRGVEPQRPVRPPGSCILEGYRHARRSTHILYKGSFFCALGRVYWIVKDAPFPLRG